MAPLRPPRPPDNCLLVQFPSGFRLASILFSSGRFGHAFGRAPLINTRAENMILAVCVVLAHSTRERRLPAKGHSLEWSRMSIRYVTNRSIGSDLVVHWRLQELRAEFAFGGWGDSFGPARAGQVVRWTCFVAFGHGNAAGVAPTHCTDTTSVRLSVCVLKRPASGRRKFKCLSLALVPTLGHNLGQNDHWNR